VGELVGDEGPRLCGPGVEPALAEAQRLAGLEGVLESGLEDEGGAERGVRLAGPGRAPRP
jgi:hypothetical protein